MSQQADQVPATPGVATFAVEVVRSRRRKRTVGAQMVGGVLRITVPDWMSRAEESHWVDTMSKRFRRSMSTASIDLAARATTLARRYDLPRPKEIRWVGDMSTRWASCTPSTGVIRVSDRLGRFPAWVLDYVIVHELAHLVVPDHSSEFWRTVHRFERAERAIGYLMASSGSTGSEDDGLD